MQKEKVTLYQSVATIVLFNFGSSVIMGINITAKQDTWLAILMAAAIGVPLFLIYAQIFKRFPGKDLYEIAEVLFGKIGGKVIAVVMIWFCTYLAALVLRAFSEFTEVSTLQRTPQLPILVLMTLATVYLARSNARAIGKWSVISAFLVLFVVVFTFFASANKMKVEDILPIMGHSTAELAESAFEIFGFPFAETVVFLCLGNSLNKDSKPIKMLFCSLVIIMVIFLMVFFRNLTLLGSNMMDICYFPSYVAVRTIEIGDFLVRIEGFITSNFFFAGIVKVSVCLLAASRGLMRLFNLPDYHPMVTPIGMLALALSVIVYSNTMEMFTFMEYYSYYAFPFQVIIPMIIWIAGEIHARKQRKKAEPKPLADAS